MLPTTMSLSLPLPASDGVSGVYPCTCDVSKSLPRSAELTSWKAVRDILPVHHRWPRSSARSHKGSTREKGSRVPTEEKPQTMEDDRVPNKASSFLFGERVNFPENDGLI